jgi:hypothetical protein
MNLACRQKKPFRYTRGIADGRKANYFPGRDFSMIAIAGTKDFYHGFARPVQQGWWPAAFGKSHPLTLLFCG